jgi:hypothetical protein
MTLQWQWFATTVTSPPCSQAQNEERKKQREGDEVPPPEDPNAIDIDDAWSRLCPTLINISLPFLVISLYIANFVAGGALLGLQRFTAINQKGIWLQPVCVYYFPLLFTAMNWHLRVTKMAFTDYCHELALSSYKNGKAFFLVLFTFIEHVDNPSQPRSLCS